MICSTNTIYQDHLSNLLYEDMACKKSSLLFGDNIADMMEKVRTSQQELIDEVKFCNLSMSLIGIGETKQRDGCSNGSAMVHEWNRFHEVIAEEII